MLVLFIFVHYLLATQRNFNFQCRMAQEDKNKISGDVFETPSQLHKANF